jgi:hypothetical protein
VSEPALAGAASHERRETPAAGQAPRIAVVGMSLKAACGMRDHATLLTDALAERGFSCSTYWLSRRESSLQGARGEVRAWARSLERDPELARASAVLVHYSAFAYSHRGVPLLAHPVLRSLRQLGAPRLAVMHELAYPWGHEGWRGLVWAATQRAAMLELVRASGALIVTADFQQRWLSSRAWLPERPLRVAPVFSNLPPPHAAPTAARDGHEVGVFGYAYQGAATALVLDAIASLSGHGLAVRLALLGAPGPDSDAGEQWRAAARARGIEELLRFDGPLPAQELSDALAACDVLVMCDASGPTSRKGTLAASLASGSAVVALDGPRTWPELVGDGAVELVGASAEDLAGALERLLADGDRRRQLGTRGRAFAERRMSLTQTADAATALLGQLLGAR